MSKTHLQRYLDQFDFMYSMCKQTDSARMHAVIDRAGGRRLTYKPPDWWQRLTRRTAGMATPAARQSCTVIVEGAGIEPARWLPRASRRTSAPPGPAGA